LEATLRKQYSDAFIEQALIKVYSRGESRTIRDVAVELNVSYVTLRNWVKRKTLDDVSASAAKEKRPQDWQRDQQLAALMETHGLGEEALQAWCREHGIFPHHLDSWRAGFVTEQAPVRVPEGQVLKALKNENDELKAELRRKEKALAEAAALLVLQKKFRALWDTEDK
jgi:transposase-like protein